MAEDLRIPSALMCPYYWYLGKCASSCWYEDACHVDEPLGGWRIRDARGRFITRAREAEVVAKIRTEMQAEADRHG